MVILSYRANESDNAAWERAKRPNQCKLSQYPALYKIVAKKLRANWLRDTYPDVEKNQVSHETIYKTLFIQGRGDLKKRA